MREVKNMNVEIVNEDHIFVKNKQFVSLKRFGEAKKDMIEEVKLLNDKNKELAEENEALKILLKKQLNDNAEVTPSTEIFVSKMCSLEYQDFNTNDYVKVKLTEKGKYIYYHQFDDMNVDILKRGCKPLEPVELKYDNDGYVEFQLWYLMGLFGKYLFNGCEVPFETTIKFKVSI